MTFDVIYLVQVLKSGSEFVAAVLLRVDVALYNVVKATLPYLTPHGGKLGWQISRVL